jgi:hypothetical protein
MIPMSDPTQTVPPINTLPAPEWNEDQERDPTSVMQFSAGTVLSSEIPTALAYAPFQSGLRMLDPSLKDSPANTFQVTGDNADFYNQQFGVQGGTPEDSISYKPGDTINVSRAQAQSQLLKQKLANNYIASHGPTGLEGWATNELGGLIGQGLDPTSYLPASWLGKGAIFAADALKLERTAQVARGASDFFSGSAIGRISGAALNNASAVALTQPILLAGAEQDHSDYDFSQAAQNVLFGGLLGAGLHGLGEGIGKLWDGAHGLMQAGAQSVENDVALHPQLTADAMNASREQVTSDLGEQLGRAPTDDEINTEQAGRANQIVNDMQAGKYGSEPVKIPEDDIESGTAPEVQAQVSDALANDDYGTAAQALEGQNKELESGLTDVKPEDTEALNAPNERFGKIKTAVQSFIGCVAGEAGQESPGATPEPETAQP